MPPAQAQSYFLAAALYHRAMSGYLIFSQVLMSDGSLAIARKPPSGLASMKKMSSSTCSGQHSNSSALFSTKAMAVLASTLACP